jgi:hypothetical protein
MRRRLPATHAIASRALLLLTAAIALTGVHPGAYAQDRNITLPVTELERMLQSDPMHIVKAEISRPKAKGDITLKADVAFAGRPPMRVKVRKAEPGADTFNNVPRYDLAAYELQKLLMDEAGYVVPPTALRMVPLAELREVTSTVDPAPVFKSTFKGADEVLCVVQYWLQDVKVPVDVLDPSRLEADAVYARHIGELNAFTYLIEHGDSNLGNFIMSAAPEGARVFSVDNGIAFASEASDRGEAWKSMRVKRLPAGTVDRLRELSDAELTSRLGVLAQWELRDGHYVAVPPTENLSANSGVRRKGATVQMGLTRNEIAGVWDRTRRLLKMIDAGDISTW